MAKPPSALPAKPPENLRAARAQGRRARARARQARTPELEREEREVGGEVGDGEGLRSAPAPVNAAGCEVRLSRFSRARGATARMQSGLRPRGHARETEQQRSPRLRDLGCQGFHRKASE